ncbi:LexA family transcriptional regulator [bacterium]|nr:LexA family transcriptional regulator [bacterium]
MKERELIQLWLNWKRNRGDESFSQKILAEKAGISPTYLSNIMTGMRNPGTKTLEKIAGAFGVTMAEFYGGPHQSSISASPARNNIQPAPVKTYGFSPGSARADVQESRSAVSVETDDSEYQADERQPDGSSEDFQASGETDIDEGVPEKTGLTLSDTSPDKLEKLFDSMGVSLAELFSVPPGQAPVNRESPPQKIETPEKTVQTESPGKDEKIPLLAEVPAGEWWKWFEENGEKSFSTYVPRFNIQGSFVFAVRVDDTSMVPDLHDSDLLILNPEEKFTNIDGGIGVTIHNKRFLIRKVYIHKGEYLLMPSNPAHKKTVVPIEGTRIFKVVLWIPSARGKF